MLPHGMPLPTPSCCWPWNPHNLATAIDSELAHAVTSTSVVAAPAVLELQGQLQQWTPAPRALQQWANTDAKELIALAEAAGVHLLLMLRMVAQEGNPAQLAGHNQAGPDPMTATPQSGNPSVSMSSSPPPAGPAAPLQVPPASGTAAPCSRRHNGKQRLQI
jgi:hypothetical protein